MYKIYLGIDPGQTGALAVITDSGINIYDYTDTGAMMALKRINLDLWQYEALAMIERATPMPKQGISSTWKFGTNFGQWIGRLEALDIPFGFVTPKKWQQVMYGAMPKIHMVRKGKRVLDTKSMSLERVRQSYPAYTSWFARKKDHNRADALLLAAYCQLTEKGVR